MPPPESLQLAARAAHAAAALTIRHIGANRITEAARIATDRVLGEGALQSMRAFIETELPLHEPDVDWGLVTWLRIRLLQGGPDDSEQPIGAAQAARIHIAAALNAGESLYDVLDADSADLEALHSVFFNDGELREEYCQGAGSDLLYIRHIELEPDWEGRNVDLALVRRLCDTLGEGCELAVMEVDSDAEAAHWQRMGFQRAASDRGQFLYLPLALHQARVVEAGDGASFKVVPNPASGSKNHHH